MKKLLFVLLFIISCSKEKEPQANCGEIIRLYHMNTTLQEGNPCGDDEEGTPFGDYAIIVKNDITNNEKYFCIGNLWVFVDMNLGDTYCDSYDPSGW